MQKFDPNIPWYNFGNDGNSGVRLHFSRDFDVALSNTEPGRASSVNSRMTKWYDVAIVRTTNLIHVTIDGRTIIKRTRSDFPATNGLDALFDNEMVWIANLAIGNSFYDFSLEEPGTEAAVQQAMIDGKYRLEITDISIESDQPIVTATKTLIDRVNAARRRRKRSVIVSEHRPVDPAVYQNEKVCNYYKEKRGIQGLQTTGGNTTISMSAAQADAIKAAYGMTAPTAAPTIPPASSPEQMSAAHAAAQAAQTAQ
jgi:hypothetical protein